MQPQQDGSAPKGTPLNFRPNKGGVLKKWLSAYKSSNISKTRQDRTKVTIEVE